MNLVGKMAATPGYSIESWNTESNGSGETWNFEDPIGNADLTLYAQWSDFEGKTFEPVGESTNWSETANWGGSLPTIDDVVRIKQPTTVNTTAAVAKEIVIEQDGEGNAYPLIVAADQALVVTGKIQVEKDGVLRPTTAADLKVESSAAGNGTLIFENMAVYRRAV